MTKIDKEACKEFLNRWLLSFYKINDENSRNLSLNCLQFVTYILSAVCFQMLVTFLGCFFDKLSAYALDFGTGKDIAGNIKCVGGLKLKY